MQTPNEAQPDAKDTSQTRINNDKQQYKWAPVDVVVIKRLFDCLEKECMAFKMQDLDTGVWFEDNVMQCKISAHFKFTIVVWCGWNKLLHL